MIMPFDLDGLKAFVAVADCGGFGRAAQRLNKAQSAVSHQVRKLEAQLGIALFNREGYRVQLTPVGEAVLAEGRRVLAQVEHVGTVAQQFSQGWEPRLLVIIDGILPLDPILDGLKTLAAEQVPTRIQVKVEFLSGVQSRFEREEGDLMLVVDSESRTSLEEETLPEMDCVLCVAATHPLARRKSVSLTELHEHIELSVQNSSEEQRTDRLLFGCERGFYLSSFQAKKQALLMGVGFGWMPLYLIRDELKVGDLREVKYTGSSRFRFTPKLVHRTNRKLGRTGQRLVELLRVAKWPPMSYRAPITPFRPFER
jgi:DNA-binding transcriptional LysR family regulator